MHHLRMGSLLAVPRIFRSETQKEAGGQGGKEAGREMKGRENCRERERGRERERKRRRKRRRRRGRGQDELRTMIHTSVRVATAEESPLNPFACASSSLLLSVHFCALVFPTRECQKCGQCRDGPIINLFVHAAAGHSKMACLGAQISPGIRHLSHLSHSKASRGGGGFRRVRCLRDGESTKHKGEGGERERRGRGGEGVGRA
jgi:hypothetical protein